MLRTWMARSMLLVPVAGALVATGCALPYFLFVNGDPVTPPKIQLLEGKRDKKKLVVLSYADSGLRFGFDNIDQELCGLVIGEIARNEPRFEVVPERKVRAWRDANANWADRGLHEVGQKFDADYVVSFSVERFSLNETKNQFLLQGSTSITFKVYDVAKDSVIFQEVYTKDYPPNRAVPLTDVVSEEQFRRKFLQTIARELSWNIIPHRFADTISDM